jgi:hypothetical protein
MANKGWFSRSSTIFLFALALELSASLFIDRADAGICDSAVRAIRASQAALTGTVETLTWPFIIGNTPKDVKDWKIIFDDAANIENKRIGALALLNLWSFKNNFRAPWRDFQNRFAVQNITNVMKRDLVGASSVPRSFKNYVSSTNKASLRHALIWGFGPFLWPTYYGLVRSQPKLKFSIESLTLESIEADFGIPKSNFVSQSLEQLKEWVNSTEKPIREIEQTNYRRLFNRTMVSATVAAATLIIGINPVTHIAYFPEAPEWQKYSLMQMVTEGAKADPAFNPKDKKVGMIMDRFMWEDFLTKAFTVSRSQNDNPLEIMPLAIFLEHQAKEFRLDIVSNDEEWDRAIAANADSDITYFNAHGLPGKMNIAGKDISHRLKNLNGNHLKKGSSAIFVSCLFGDKVHFEQSEKSEPWIKNSHLLFPEGEGKTLASVDVLSNVTITDADAEPIPPQMPTDVDWAYDKAKILVSTGTGELHLKKIHQKINYPHGSFSTFVDHLGFRTYDVATRQSNFHEIDATQFKQIQNDQLWLWPQVTENLKVKNVEYYRHQWANWLATKYSSEHPELVQPEFIIPYALAAKKEKAVKKETFIIIFPSKPPAEEGPDEKK